jgi:hypothetical protein
MLFIEPTITDPRLQAKHTRLATSLLHSACGDLCLNRRGDLCRKEVYDENWNALALGDYRYGAVLAHISHAGWELTSDGAQFILENCGFDRRDEKLLVSIARGGEARS